VRVVLTRPEEKDAELKSLLAAAGVEAVSVPVVAYVRLEEGYRALEAALGEPWDWVVLTSPEAARYFIGAWYLAGAPAVPLAAIGATTRRLLEGQGMEVAFGPSRAEGRVLAEELPGSGRVLWPTSARSGDALSRRLEARGFVVRRIEVYTLEARMPTPRERELVGGADAVAFGSPSAVEAWVAAGLPRLPAACVGRGTAERAEALGFAPVRYPEAPGLSGWVEAIRAL